MKQYFALVALYFTFTTLVFAQNSTVRCGQSYVEQTIQQAYGNPDSIREEFFSSINLENNRPSGTEATVYTIPVVFHVIYDSEEDNITLAQIQDAIRVLNRDYRRLNADTANTRAIFKGVAADAEIEFRLAKVDPNGNCTDGVTRTQSSLTVEAHNNVKQLSHWPNNKYLNIWTVRSIKNNDPSGTILGYAYKPLQGQNYIYDGIVVRHDQTGTIGSARNSLGRTLVHEAGHYLGLDHPFRNGCFGGDGCADTPPVTEASNGCNLNANTCSNDVGIDLPDQIENYMDYADDVCTNMFTLDQVSIMRASLANSNLRGYLITQNNLAATGITPNQALPCAPEPDFYTTPSLICTGQTVQFFDNTIMGNPTSFSWSFPGGTPTSSTDLNPTVTYNTAGNYDVTLTSTNAYGTVVKFKKGVVSVRSQNTTPYINAFYDDFENYALPNNNWHVEPGLDTNNFKYFTTAAYAGQSCVTLQNVNALPLETDALISHAISLENSTSATLNFKYAFAERSFGNSDKLSIYVSDDCGQTWDFIKSQQGPFLRTTNTRTAASWHPTTQNEWGNGSVDLNNYAPSTNYIMVKFEFTNGGGNNFYLDEVQLAPTIGLKENNVQQISVFPNPAKSTVNVHLAQTEFADITITDITGRTVVHKQNTSAATELNIGHLTIGLYVLTVKTSTATYTEKLLVE